MFKLNKTNLNLNCLYDYVVKLSQNFATKLFLLVVAGGYDSVLSTKQYSGCDDLGDVHFANQFQFQQVFVGIARTRRIYDSRHIWLVK